MSGVSIGQVYIVTGVHALKTGCMQFQQSMLLRGAHPETPPLSVQYHEYSVNRNSMQHNTAHTCCLDRSS